MCGDAAVGESVLPLQRQGNEIKQFYQNLCDQPGGYHKVHMLLSNHTPDDPVLEPMCMPGRSLIFCAQSDVMVHKEPKRPRIIVNQSAIIWQGAVAPKPSVGQNLLSFCGGASKY